MTAWPISKRSPRSVIGDRIVQSFLESDCKDAHFGRGIAPGGDNKAIFHTLDDVWLWLPTEGLADPFTGEQGVWAAAKVLNVMRNGMILVVTERYLLKGTVPADRLKKRLPGEIAPGRTSLSAGNART